MASCCNVLLWTRHSQAFERDVHCLAHGVPTTCKSAGGTVPQEFINFSHANKGVLLSPGDDSNYDFGYSQAGGTTVIREFKYQNARVRSCHTSDTVLLF